MSSTRVGSSLACKYQNRVEEIDSDKHPSLVCYIINYGCKKFYEKKTHEWDAPSKTPNVKEFDLKHFSSQNSRQFERRNNIQHNDTMVNDIQ